MIIEDVEPLSVTISDGRIVFYAGYEGREIGQFEVRSTWKGMRG